MHEGLASLSARPMLVRNSGFVEPGRAIDVAINEPW
jgi:hypothetical protein